jgi:putative DNA primase/helicase
VTLEPHLNGRVNGAYRPRIVEPFGEQPDSGEVGDPFVLEWAHRIEPHEHSSIVKGLIPAASLLAIYGPPRAGKSFLALEWALRLANGDDVLGMRSQRVGVAYVAPEAPNGVRKRVRGWMLDRGQEGEVIPFALIGRRVDFSSPEAADVQDLIESLQEAKIEFKEHGASLELVFVDTLARAMPGADENISADMGNAIAAMERISKALGVTICLVHHTGKEASRGLRGHSSLFAALDAAIELTLDEETGARRLKVAKQKDDEDGGSWGFTLRRVTIGEDSDGDPVTTCVVDYVDVDTRTRATVKPGKREALVYRAVKNAISNGGEAPPSHVVNELPPGIIVTTREAVRREADRLGLSQADVTNPTDDEVRKHEAAARQEFSRSIKTLIGQGLVGHYSLNNREGYLWLTR